MIVFIPILCTPAVSTRFGCRNLPKNTSCKTRNHTDQKWNQKPQKKLQNQRLHTDPTEATNTTGRQLNWPIIQQPKNCPNERPRPTASTHHDRFSSDAEGMPCLTLAVTGGGKFSAEEEAKALHAKIQEEIEGISSDGKGRASSSSDSRKTCVRIATPPELYCAAEGRDVFPNLFPNLSG